MTLLSGKDRSGYVRGMFGRIAQSYDRLNRIMTLGQDRKWRKEAAQALDLSPGVRILDLGSGTGDMLYEILQHDPKSTVVGVDLTPEMILIGRKRAELSGVLWVIADVHNLPFPDRSFDGITSAFLMRNLSKIGPAFEEQHRVLCDQGRLVCLETAPLKKSWKYFLINFYLNRFIPFIGHLISRDIDAYIYLSASMRSFNTPETLAEALCAIGFREVHFVRKMFGTVAIHTAKKPDLIGEIS